MDLTTLLLIGMIGIVIGFLLNALVNNLRGKSAAPPPAASIGLKEEARLFRDRRNGKIVVEVDGQVYRLVGELDANARRRLTQAAGDLRLWVGLPVTLSLSESRQTPAVSAAPGSPSVEPASLNPLKAFSGAFDEVGKSALGAPGKSIAAQIDEILQHKLENTPLAGKGIRLMELPGQGMVVMVGLKKYSDLESVSDPAVRAAIAQAVAEWEGQAAQK